MNARNILQFSIGPLGAAVFGFITLPVLAWFYSAEDIGRLTMLQVAVSFSILFFSLGLDQAFVREYHESIDKNELLKTVLLPGLLLFIATFGLISLSPFSVPSLLFGFDSLYISVLLFLCVLFAFLSRFLSLILRMQEKGLAYSIGQVSPKLLFLVIVMSYVSLSFTLSFESLITSHALALLSVLIIYVWYTRKDWLPAITARINRESFIRMTQFGLPLIVGGIAFWGLVSIDRFFLRSMSSFRELGIYSVAVNFAGAALIFQTLFSTVWAPTIYKWAAKELKPQKVQQVIEYIAFGIVIIWSLAGMLSWVVTFILPPEYSRVEYILVACMGYPLLYTLSEATGVGIGIQRKTIYAMLAAIMALLLNAALNYILIPRYGAEGAALSSVFSFLLYFIVKTEVSLKLVKNIFPRRGVAYFYIAVMIMLVTYSIIVEYNALHSAVLWFLVLIIYSIHHKKLILKAYDFFK